MQDSCYSLTGGPWGQHSPSDTPDYFKWCHMCHLAPAYYSQLLHGLGMACSVLCGEQKWYPNGPSTFSRKMRGRIGVLSAEECNCRAAIPAEQLLTCFTSRDAYFSFLVIFHWEALSGVLWAGLDVPHTLLSSRLLVGETGAKGSPLHSGAKCVVLCKKSHDTPVQSPSPWQLCLAPYRFHWPGLPFPNILGDQHKISSNMVLVSHWYRMGDGDATVSKEDSKSRKCPFDFRGNLADPDLVAVLRRWSTPPAMNRCSCTTHNFKHVKRALLKGIEICFKKTYHLDSKSTEVNGTWHLISGFWMGSEATSLLPVLVSHLQSFLLKPIVKPCTFPFFFLNHWKSSNRHQMSNENISLTHRILKQLDSCFLHENKPKDNPEWYLLIQASYFLV